MDEVTAPPGLHNNVPVAVVDKTELPQLLVTLTVGVEGTAFGAAVPVPDALLHPTPLVAVTEYVPELVTVMDEVTAPPGLQNNVPVEAVDNTELPQLFVTTTVGVAGTALGAEVPVAVLVQPLAWVAVTV
jgi:hypothetical protein